MLTIGLVVWLFVGGLAVLGAHAFYFEVDPGSRDAIAKAEAYITGHLDLGELRIPSRYSFLATAA
jgi:hypothetical protein